LLIHLSVHINFQLAHFADQYFFSVLSNLAPVFLQEIFYFGFCFRTDHKPKPILIWFLLGRSKDFNLVTILQHLRSNRRRSRYRSPIVPDTDDRLMTTPFVPPVPQMLTDEDVLGALERIPERFQEVIVLCDVEELSYKEIAAALEIPLGTVMSRLHRGRALLRSELGAASLPGRCRTHS